MGKIVDKKAGFKQAKRLEDLAKGLTGITKNHYRAEHVHGLIRLGMSTITEWSTTKSEQIAVDLLRCSIEVMESNLRTAKEALDAYDNDPDFQTG